MSVASAPQLLGPMAQRLDLPPAFPGNFWAAPLVWVALAWTAGIVIDRLFAVSLSTGLVVALISISAWLGSRRNPRFAVAALAGVLAGAGMVHHHLSTRRILEDDISRFVSEEASPAKLWGVVYSEPVLNLATPDPLLSIPGHDGIRFVLEVEACEIQGNMPNVSGLVQISAPAKIPVLHVGDRVRVLGHLARPSAPANPTDLDYAKVLSDQGIRTVMSVPESVVLERPGWHTSYLGWLGAFRSWAAQALARHLPPERVGVAAALLLGDVSGMSRTDWQRYINTGVVHVLVVSGQHLVVLAAMMELILAIGQCRRRSRRLLIAALLISYALLTGGRPPVMRAAWIVAAGFGAMLARRVVMPANTFALAWIGVSLLHPADVFDIGCQWSFLATLFLIWGPLSWLESEQESDPLAALRRETQPLTAMICGRIARWLACFYLANFVIWIVITPLGILRYNHVTPVAILLGPPVVLFSSIALVTGFLLLIAAMILPPLAPLFAWPTGFLLGLCDYLVDLGEKLPGAHFYVPDLPTWWIAIFYFGAIPGLTFAVLRRHWRRTCAAVLTWSLVSSIVLWGPRPAGSFRCTFLAVGHGGCTVLETSAGRVILYDTGALAGPDVTRRHIAPFLWRRGFWRVDDVVLSHADTDHYNGLPALLEYFSVGQVTMTPFFAERDNQAVRLTLEAVERRAIPMRQVKTGERWQTDDVLFEVLHPPPKTPAWSQNARSLVLLVEQNGRSLLLTGDLQDQGLDLVMKRPAPRIDVLMAPHHGSKTSNTPAFADWAAPQAVISCQRRPRDGKQPMTPFERNGVPFFGTWPHGAVSILEDGESWRLETFKTSKVLRLR